MPMNLSPAAWLARLRRSAANRATPGMPARWVVLDVETTGLDAHRDRLLAVAAVAVRVPHDGARPWIALDDAFERVVRPDGEEGERPVDRPNILLHGIGIGEQRAGVPAPQALAELQAWLGEAPVLGFHVAFDETMLRRAFAAARLPAPRNAFVDLEHVAESLRPSERARSLDDWMATLGVHCLHRHRAAADALATAEILLRLWPEIGRESGRAPPDLRLLQRLAAQRKWLTQQGR